MSFLYQSEPVRGAAWARIFAEQAPEIEFRQWPDAGDLDAVEYLAAWQPPPDLLARLPNLKVLFSVGAGVDHLNLSTLPEHIQVVRMVEPGIINGMVEYVTLSVLALHRNLFDYQRQQANAMWREIQVVPAASRRVGVMGLGVLGQAVLAQLTTFGYACSGWSRSYKEIAGVRCFAGAESLQPFLAQCDILICLLPLTHATRGILNEQLFAALPRGASVINVGRGAQLVAQDLLVAVNSGHLSQAILDVTEPEPLPADHPFWHHPRILLTPHIASMTQADSAARVLIENLHRHRRGDALHDVIDRRKGY